MEMTKKSSSRSSSTRRPSPLKPTRALAHIRRSSTRRRAYPAGRRNGLSIRRVVTNFALARKDIISSLQQSLHGNSSPPSIDQSSSFKENHDYNNNYYNDDYNTSLPHIKELRRHYNCDCSYGSSLVESTPPAPTWSTTAPSVPASAASPTSALAAGEVYELGGDNGNASYDWWVEFLDSLDHGKALMVSSSSISVDLHLDKGSNHHHHHRHDYRAQRDHHHYSTFYDDQLVMVGNIVGDGTASPPSSSLPSGFLVDEWLEVPIN